MLRFTLVCRPACELVHRRTRLSAQRRTSERQPSTLGSMLVKVDNGFNVVINDWCRQCGQNIKRRQAFIRDLSNDHKVYEPRIGSYRLPYPDCLPNPLAFNSFLFKAFGCEVMMQRLWYTHHVWRYVLCLRGDLTNLWRYLRSAQEADVTDKTVDKLNSYQIKPRLPDLTRDTSCESCSSIRSRV